MDNVTFDTLSRELYQPLLEKQHRELNETIEGIFSDVAARGFSIPPGFMYSNITKACKESLPAVATLIWQGLSQAYNVCHKRPTVDELDAAITDAIILEARRLVAHLNYILEQQNAQRKLPHVGVQIEQYEHEILSEGRRLVRRYVAESKVLIAQAKDKVANPFEAKPKLFGFGVDLMKLAPWLKQLFKRNKHKYRQ